MELLLRSLRDEDTVVRWSAAKGVGRIGARLPAMAAADVCDSVLTLFADNERDTAWHGGCMALAELGPQRLFSSVICVSEKLTLKNSIVLRVNVFTFYFSSNTQRRGVDRI